MIKRKLNRFASIPAAAAALGCALAGTGHAHPPQTQNAQAMNLANEAILITSGETKILFDPLFSSSYGYPLVSPEMEAALMAGAAPFDGVDAVFISHVHGDHFDAAKVNAYLAAHPGVQLVAPFQARLDLRSAEGWQDAFEDRLNILAFIAAPQELVLAADGHDSAIRIEAVHIPHAGGAGRAHIQNMVHRVTLNDTATIMHMGDADPAPITYAPLDDHWQARTTHTAFPPYWIPQRLGEAMTAEMLNAQDVVGIHVPRAVPADLIASGVTYFHAPGEVRAIRVGDHAHE